eukprot:Pgem_evm1s12149
MLSSSSIALKTSSFRPVLVSLSCTCTYRFHNIITTNTRECSSITIQSEPEVNDNEWFKISGWIDRNPKSSLNTTKTTPPLSSHHNFNRQHYSYSTFAKSTLAEIKTNGNERFKISGQGNRNSRSRLYLYPKNILPTNVDSGNHKWFEVSGWIERTTNQNLKLAEVTNTTTTITKSIEKLWNNVNHQKQYSTMSHKAPLRTSRNDWYQLPGWEDQVYEITTKNTALVLEEERIVTRITTTAQEEEQQEEQKQQQEQEQNNIQQALINDIDFDRTSELYGNRVIEMKEMISTPGKIIEITNICTRRRRNPQGFSINDLAFVESNSYSEA